MDCIVVPVVGSIENAGIIAPAKADAPRQVKVIGLLNDQLEKNFEWRRREEPF
jgi:hypothetical protein